MKKILKNWKTSLAGLGAILTGAAMIVKGNYVEGIASVSAGIGLLKAKDSNVTGGTVPNSK